MGKIRIIMNNFLLMADLIEESIELTRSSDPEETFLYLEYFKNLHIYI